VCVCVCVCVCAYTELKSLHVLIFKIIRCVRVCFHLHAAAQSLKIVVCIDHHSRVQVHSSDDDMDELNIVASYSFMFLHKT
jgi:hypothetical protein